MSSVHRRLHDGRFLQLYVPGNNHVEDVSGNGYTTAWMGTPGYTQGVLGGRGVPVMDGANHCIHVTADAALRAAGEDNTTMCCWARSDIAASGYASIGYVMDFGFAHSQGLGIMYVGNHAIGTNGQIVLYYNNGLDSGVVAAANVWYHIALVRIDSGSGIMNCYIDGELMSTSAMPAITISAAYDLSIGCQAKDHARRFDGNICNARLYNVALSGDEIKALYLHELRGAL